MSDDQPTKWVDTISQMDIFDLCDCLEDELKHGDDFRDYPFRAFMNIYFPESQYLIAAFFEIRILRFIFCDLFFLPLVRVREFVRIAMPIITIKLDNQIRGFNKCINAKLLTNSELRSVRNPDTINYIVGYFFKVIWMERLLIGIEFYKSLGMLWVVIPALLRTVYSVAVGNSRRGRKENHSTYFTCKFKFVPRLPFVCTLMGTKSGRSPVRWNIKNNRTYLACFIAAPFFGQRAASTQTTFIRTIFLRAKKRLTALWAIMIFTTLRYSTFCWHIFSYLFASIILWKIAINNPVVLCEYVDIARKRLAEPYTMPMFEEQPVKEKMAQQMELELV